jgi:integrase
LLIARARKFPRASHQAIRLFHDGTLIYTLAFRPLRVASVVAIRIGQELELSGAAVGHLCLPAAAMKAKRQWDIDLNIDLSDILREWVSDYRRFLARSATSPYLFISRQPSRTGALTIQGAGKIVRRWTLAYLGRSLSPHDFRHAAGTMLLDEFPDQPWIGSAILQHNDPKTLATYSKGHDTLRASDQFTRIVDRARKRAQSQVRR